MPMKHMSPVLYISMESKRPNKKNPKFTSCIVLIKKKIRIFSTERLYSKKIISRNGKEIIEMGKWTVARGGEALNMRSANISEVR